MNKKLVLLILVDGLRHDYINHVDSPFLHSLCENNIDAIVRETFAFELRPAFFAGLQPDECDIANMFCYDPDNSIFRSIDLEHGNREKITQQVRNEAKKRGFSLIKEIGGCANIPIELLPYFDFSEKYHTADPGSIGEHKTLFDHLRKSGKKWLWIAYPDGPGTTEGVLKQFSSKATYDEDFIYLHFSELDWVGHEFGPHSREQKESIHIIDEAIRKIFININQSYDHVESIIFGDHGQVEIERNIDIQSILSKTNLVFGEDYLFFLDSTQARFWFFNDNAKIKVVKVLEEIKGGKILTQSELMDLHFHFNHNKFGDLIFVADEGIGIFPNFFQNESPCRGLHGYLPDVQGNWAKLIITGIGERRKIGKPFEMVSIFPTLLKMLGLDNPEDVKKPSFFELEKIKTDTEKYTSSIVIPTYNRVEKLKKCLFAIEKQSYQKKAYEVIVIDDGSTDNTEEFLKAYKKSNTINLRYHKQANMGPAAARNYGIENAKGNIIILLGDDMIMGYPDFIKDHIEFHLEWSMLSHACMGYIEWAKEIKSNIFLELITSTKGGQQFSYEYFKGKDKDNVGWIGFLGSNISFKRDFCLTHGLFNHEKFKHAMWEDTELGYRLEKYGLMIHYRENIFVYHDHFVDFERFSKRQKMVGWYNAVVSELGVPVAINQSGYEKNIIYSSDVLDEITSILKNASPEAQGREKEILIEVYNYGLRYSELLGNMEYNERGDGYINGKIALLYNLAIAGNIATNYEKVIEKQESMLVESERVNSLLAEENELLKEKMRKLNSRLEKKKSDEIYLQEILNSKSWMLITFVRGVRLKMIPKNSRREYCAKLVFKYLKNYINKYKGIRVIIKKAIKYYYNNGMWRTFEECKKRIIAKKNKNGKMDELIESFPEKFSLRPEIIKNGHAFAKIINSSAEESLNKLLPKLDISIDACGLLEKIKSLFGKDRYFSAVNDIFTIERTICNHRKKSEYALIQASELQESLDSKNRKKILYITSLFPSSHHGGGNRVINFIKASSKNNDIYLFTPYDAADDENEYKELLNYCKSIYCIPYSQYGKNQIEISNWLQDNYMDIVHYEWPASLENYSKTYGRYHIFTYMEAVSLRLMIDMGFFELLTPQWVDKFCKLLNALNIELSQASNLDARVAVTTKDANFFKKIYPFQKYTILNHGLSFDEFCLPDIESEVNCLVFVGNYTHYPNADAMRYFFKEIWYRICLEIPDSKIYIVGANPPVDLKRMADGKRIIVTGKVPDVRPFIQKATLCIAPLVTGAGLRGKVVEYAALKRTFVATSIATTDLTFKDGNDYLRADNEIDFSNAVIELLKNDKKRNKMAFSAYKTARLNYDTRQLVSYLERLYNQLENSGFEKN